MRRFPAKVWKSGFDLTNAVKPGQCFLPEVLFLGFPKECHISKVNPQFVLENRGYFQRQFSP